MAKSKYETHVGPKLSLIEKWARDGLTMEQIAANLGINPDTLYRHKRTYPELSEALKNGKDVADAQVVNKLYQAAIGYYYMEEVMAANGDIKEIKRYAKPNTTAQIFWLKNREPEAWREKHEVGLSGEIKTVNEKHYHIVQQMVSDPAIAQHIRENFRRPIG